MRKATSILLNEDSQAFIGKKEREAKIEAIRAALIEGEESGIAEHFDTAVFLKRMREKHAAKS